MSLADQAARDAIRTDLATTLIVEAAAGTGKTTELVQRVLSLLKSGAARLSSIVAVTFTEKAAGELKLRLRGEIEKARADVATPADEKARLDASLEELEQAHIGTIHAFCAELLRERPVEAKVDPLFEVAAEEGKDRLVDEAFDRWFQKELSDPREGTRRVLRRRAQGRDATGPREVLRRAAGSLIEQRDFDAPWTRVPFERAPAIDALLEKVYALADVAMADPGDDYLGKNLLDVKLFADENRMTEQVRARDYDALEVELKVLARKSSWKWTGRGRMFGERTRSEVIAERNRVKQELDRVLAAADADLAAHLFQELRDVVREYEAMKTRARKLDFLDMLILAHDVLETNKAVRNELQARYTHLLVDEFQDTDPLQAQILLLLAADDPDERKAWNARPIAGKLFAVGDPKQSIYSFRRADVALYTAVKRRLVKHGAKLVHLTTSFRSAPSIQRAVNAAFADVMVGNAEGSQAEYVPLEPFRPEPEGRPTVIALPVPRPYGDYRKIVTWKIEESMPGVVAGFVQWLLETSGWTIAEREKPDERVRIQARHVCLLFKRFQSFGRDVTREYVHALEVRRIPHVLVGGKSFHAREEIMAMRNALYAIEWPDDELSVFATLRGPFFALNDDALLAFRHTQKTFHALKKHDPKTLDDLTRPVSEALGVLATLHVGRNRRPIADTVTRLLEATRAHAGIAFWPTGEQALANLLRVLDMARRFESAGATSFRAFASHMAEEAERGGAAEAPVVEEGTDGVRIMTVHKAKGLEFPVVVLVDPTAEDARKEPSRYVENKRKLWAMPLAGCVPQELLDHKVDMLRRDREEADRLVYVAATRARELLVVPACGDEAIQGWLSVLDPVVYPEALERRSSLPAPGCPDFGEDSVEWRPENVDRDANDSVRPGLHRPQKGTHSVVWWDPRALVLDKHDDVGLRQQRILAADEGGLFAREGERAHAAWQAKRAAALARGEVKTLHVRTFSEVKESAMAAAVKGTVALEETSAGRAGRPHGMRFGTLVHAVLATVDLRAAAADVTRVAAAQARILGASPDEAEAATQAAVAALAHPLFARARAASACRRESPVLMRLPDGSLVDGVLDLAFREDGAGWTVVDFKTDVELARRRPEYEAQVSLYARAVALATGEETRAVLLSV